MKPRCPSVSPNGYRCRRRVHDPVPPDPLPPDEVCHRATSWQGVELWDDESALEPPTQVVSMGEVTWDVGALIEAAQGKPVQQVSVRRYVEPDLVKAHHWRTVDVYTPIILAPHPDSGWLVALDGRHRLYKAYRQGRTAIGAVVLSAEEEYAARLDPERVAEVQAAHESWEEFVAGR